MSIFDYASMLLCFVCLIFSIEGAKNEIIAAIKDKGEK